MASGLQLSRDDLVIAYRRMRTIREFEDAVHARIRGRQHSGFRPSLCRRGGLGRRRLHASRVTATRSPRPIAATAIASPRALTSDGDDERDLRPEGRSVRRQGRVDAHRRPVEGDARRQRHRRRRRAACLRRCADRQDPEDWRRRSRASTATARSNQGAVLESYNLAKIWNLPVVFVAEDNGYAESTASSWSVAGSQVGRATGFGIPSREVDGSDFFDVYEAAGEAIERARSRRRTVAPPCQAQSLLRPLRGRCRDLPAARRGARARKQRDPIEAVPRACRRGRADLGGRARCDRPGGCKRRSPAA